MGVLDFTLTEEGVAALRDCLVCLGKFSDEVTIEAKADQFVLTTITPSKNAYASFSLATGRFFSKYRYEGNAQFRDKFYCTLYIRTLVAIFRPRSGGGDTAEKSSAIERCEASIHDGPDIKSRFVAKFLLRNGVTTRHRIPFETNNPVHARFDKNEAVNTWSISARTLRQLMEQHVGGGADLLDIHTDEENVNFTYFTEKPMTGDEVLRKPLHTSIAVDVEEFEALEVEDGLHIVMTVKDFRAVINHAALANASITARYSLPGRPLQFSYSGDAVVCEFLLMTVGERNNPGQKTKKKIKLDAGANRSRDHQLEAASTRGGSAGSGTRREGTMQPPSSRYQHSEYDSVAPAAAATITPAPIPRASMSRFAGFDLRPTQQGPPAGTAASEGGLFVEDDRQWDSLDAQEAEAEKADDDDARLDWAYENDSGDPPAGSILQQAAGSETGEARRSMSVGEDQSMGGADESIEPTQRLSDVQKLGLF